jgi:hypothetical protein
VQPGEFVTVRIDRAGAQTLYGTPVQDVNQGAKRGLGEL